MSDEQPYGEPFTDEWRAEHVERADAALAEFDEAMRVLSELGVDDVGPTVADFMATARIRSPGRLQLARRAL